MEKKVAVCLREVRGKLLKNENMTLFKMQSSSDNPRSRAGDAKEQFEFIRLKISIKHSISIHFNKINEMTVNCINQATKHILSTETHP